LDKLASRHFDGVSPDLRANVLAYYKDRKVPTSPPSKKETSDWIKQIELLDQLSAEVAITP
jgi:hypothetical protein